MELWEIRAYRDRLERDRNAAVTRTRTGIDHIFFSQMYGGPKIEKKGQIKMHVLLGLHYYLKG